jgi:hypothetical protein
MRSLALATLVMLTAVAMTGETPGSGRLPHEPKAQAIAAYGAIPLHFEANQGQTDDQVRFHARGPGYGLFLTSTESVLVLRKPDRGRSGPGEVLRMKLLGANPRPAIEGREKLPGKSHYFIGNDPKKWRTNVPQYARVEYEDVYPGVSLTYYGNQSQLEYDFVVSPGADPRRIRLGIEGADGIQVNAEGNLVLSLNGGEAVQKAPLVYQEVDGARKAVEGRFVLRGRREVGFEVGAYEAHRPLVLDPVLMYSTYLGGSGDETCAGIAVDPSGNVYVTGYTYSVNFPTVTPIQAANGGSTDAFVLKLNASGSALLYSTYLGGSNIDEGSAIAVDTAGNAYVTGRTQSTNFPTANALQGSNGGDYDAFVAKVNAAGSALVYSTYAGGGSYDTGRDLAVDTAGNAYVTGDTTSIDFPTANPLQVANAGGLDVFVAKVDASGSGLVYSTYLGGSGHDAGNHIAVDVSGNAYLTGYTISTNFPTVNPIQDANHGGVSDSFVAKLNTTGSALVYSTYLGGMGWDIAWGIAVDSSGSAYVTGFTQSPDFPTSNPLQPTLNGYTDAFVAKLNPEGSAFVYCTYLGGLSDDWGGGIAVDASGNVYVAGSTYSTDFPTAHPLQATNRGLYDVFVAKLNAAGSALIHSTYLGGLGDDSGTVVVDSSGNAYIAGSTASADFPTTNPLQAANGGGRDVFVAKIGFGYFHTLTPCRLVDTREPGGLALTSAQPRNFIAAGACSIPLSAVAIAVNVTAVAASGDGYLTVYPAGPPPLTSTLNFLAGQTRASNAVVGLSPTGTLAVSPLVTGGGTVHLVVDVSGYFD